MVSSRESLNRGPNKIKTQGKRKPSNNLHTKQKSNMSSKTNKKRTAPKKKYRKVPPSNIKKALTMLWNILFYIFLCLIIGGTIFFNFNDSPDRSLFGYRFMSVLTNSMAPNPEKPELTDGFTSGAVIIIQQVNPEALEAGDIITFYPVPGNTDSYLTHRVIETMDNLDGEEGLFIKTKGDANTGEDIPIRGNQVVGKVVFAVPFIGHFLNFIRDNLVVVAVFFATLFGLFLILKYYIGQEKYERVPVSKKRKKKR